MDIFLSLKRRCRGRPHLRSVDNRPDTTTVFIAQSASPTPHSTHIMPATGRQQNRLKNRAGQNKSPVAALFIGGTSLIFATFVFVAPAMPRLNPATLDFPPLQANTVGKRSSLQGHLLATQNKHGDVPGRALGTDSSREPSVVQGHVTGQNVGQGDESVSSLGANDGLTPRERVPPFEDTATHARMNAPFGSRINHDSELQSNIIDPRRIQVISLDNPRAFLYKRFMSDAECDFMVVGTCACF